MKKIINFVVLSLVFLFSIAVTNAEDFLRVYLPYGIEFSVPSSMRVLHKQEVTQIAKWSSNLLNREYDPRSDKKERLYVARDQDRFPNLIVRVSRVPTDLKQSDLVNATKKDAEEFATVVMKDSERMQSKMKFWNIVGDNVWKDGLAMVRVSYDRTSMVQNATWHVNQYYIPTNGSLIIFVVSHKHGVLEAETFANRIYQSLRVDL